MVVFGTPLAESIEIEHITMNNVHIHMNRCGLIFVLQSKTHEYGCLRVVVAVDTIHKVAAALDHTLIDKTLEGFLLTAVAVVEEKLVPKAAVDEMAGGMLRAAHVEIHMAPVFIGFL